MKIRLEKTESVTYTLPDKDKPCSEKASLSVSRARNKPTKKQLDSSKFKRYFFIVLLAKKMCQSFAAQPNKMKNSFY